MSSGVLKGANDYEKLKELCLKSHKEQTVWFLNAFWEEGMSEEAEHLWKWVDKVKTFDLQKGADGNELDELNAHRFLEFFKETMTVTEMRDNLRSTGAITGTVRMVPITHILIFRFKKDWHKLVNASQGDNRKEIEEAQRLLNEVSKAFQEAEARAQEARTRLREAEAAESAAKASESAAKAREAEAKSAESDAKTREAAAKASEVEAKNKEAEARAAQAELEAALAELKAQENAFNNKTNELKAKGDDESLGQVTRNKAKAELAQHLGSDPLPLRRAKITQEAAVKKADRATQAAAQARGTAEADAKQASQARAAAEEAARQATAARGAAEKARQAAEAARQQASDAKAAADAAAEECQRKVEEAEAYLEEVKAKPGCAHGAIWFMDRELHETRAYLPERKGGYRKPQ